MKDDLVERCARAIYEEDDPWSKAWPWPNLHADRAGAESYRRIARAILAIALEEAAKVAEGQPYKEYHRPDGSPIYRTCPYTTPDGNWATQRHHTNQYGNARADAASAIRALAATGQEGGR